MKPQYERVTMPDGCSVRVYHRQLAQIPFEWHHHPEYELTLTINSRGRRFIGDHIAAYAGDDLVLVPPDMPHTWSSTERIDRARHRWRSSRGSAETGRGEWQIAARNMRRCTSCCAAGRLA